MELAELSQNNYIADTIEPIITNISIAILILLLGLMLGKLVGIIIRKLLLEIEIDKNIHKITQVRMNVTNIVSTTLSVSIYIIGFFLALQQLGLASIVTTILIVILLLAIVGSMLLGLREFFPNLIAGTKVRKKHEVGTACIIGTVKGTIKKMNWLTVEVETVEKDKIMIPYTYFLEHYKKKTKLKTLKRSSNAKSES